MRVDVSVQPFTKRKRFLDGLKARGNYRADSNILAGLRILKFRQNGTEMALLFWRGFDNILKCSVKKRHLGYFENARK